MKKKHKGYTPTPEHRAKMLENLRKAWAASRAGLPRTPRQEAANRLNITKAWAASRERGWPHTERQLAAARANIKKAQEALRLHGYPSTPRSRGASRANLVKANAALRAKGYPHPASQRAAASRNIRRAWLVSHDPANYARIHAVRLKHGLQVREVERTLALLGESPEEYAALVARFERAFVPRDEREGKIVGRLAAAAWCRLRLGKAQACWEAEALNALLDAAQPLRSLDEHQTRRRAFAVMERLLVPERFFPAVLRLLRGVERQLRALLDYRTGGHANFRVLGRRPSADEIEMQREVADLNLLDAVGGG